MKLEKPKPVKKGTTSSSGETKAELSSTDNWRVSEDNKFVGLKYTRRFAEKNFRLTACYISLEGNAEMMEP